MGLFSQRPEYNEEWAGLPSEPDRPETVAERLTDATAADFSRVDLGALDVGGSAESIVIPVAPVIEIATAEESGAAE